jgi:hypothetical protein
MSFVLLREIGEQLGTFLMPFFSWVLKANFLFQPVRVFKKREHFGVHKDIWDGNVRRVPQMCCPSDPQASDDPSFREQ